MRVWQSILCTGCGNVVDGWGGVVVKRREREKAWWIFSELKVSVLYVCYEWYIAVCNRVVYCIWINIFL